jgi:hypothetical protein
VDECQIETEAGEACFTERIVKREPVVATKAYVHGKL